MDTSAQKLVRKFKHRVAVTVLSVLAIICTVVGSGCRILAATLPEGMDLSTFVERLVLSYQLSYRLYRFVSFHAPSLYDCITMILLIVSVVLLAVCFIKYQNRLKEKRLLAVTIVFFTVLCIVYALGRMVLCESSINQWYIMLFLLIMTRKLKSISSTAVAVGVCLGGLGPLTCLLAIPYLKLKYYGFVISVYERSIVFVFYLASSCLYYVAYTFLWISLLLVISSLMVYTPKQQLKILRKKYKKGKIPAQEYQALRAYIISRL